MTLGRFNTFPYRGHYEVAYRYRIPRGEMTDCILHSMHVLKVRRQEVVLSIAGIEGEVSGSRTIVVKIADGDQAQVFGPRSIALLQGLRESDEEAILDFEVTFRYSHLKAGKRVYLYSDNFLIRFIIVSEKFEIHVFHRKGIGRTSPVDVAALIENRLIKIIRERKLPPNVEILEELA